MRRDGGIGLGLRAVVGAAAFLLAGAGLAACSSTGGARRSGPTTIPGGGTNTTGALGATAGSFSWSIDPDPHLAIGGGTGTTIASVLAPTAGGPGWVIAGTRDGGNDSTTATVWISPDGIGWTPTTLTGSGVPSAAVAAASWKTSTVVVGSVGSGTARRAQVWVSQTPGSSFAAVPVTSTGNSPSTMDHVSVGNLGYFATGTIGGQPAVWYSTNGLQWSISSAATRFLDGFAGAQINALLATSNFVFAAGSVRDGTGTDAALWSTQDGINWKPIVPSQGAFAGGGSHVITGLAPLGTLPAGGGLLAVGGIQAGTNWAPVSWISPDGLSWSQPAGDFPGAEGPAIVRSVAPVATLVGSSEFFAAGGGPASQGLWQSTDGVRWNEIPLPAGASAATGWRATLVASDGTTTVVADGQPGQAHVLRGSPKGWVEPSANPAVFGGVEASAEAVSLRSVSLQSGSLESGKSGLELTVRVTQSPQAIGNSAVSTETLASADGVNWSGPLAAGAVTTWPPGPLPGGAAAVTRAAPGWLAVGSGPAGTPPPGSGPVTEGVGLAWTSADGTHWAAPATLDPKPTIGPESPVGACSTGSVAAAVGETTMPGSGTSAAAWFTEDGSQWKPADVSNTSGPGGGDEMFGCVATASGFEGFGATTGSAGDAPALWSSVDGTRWSRTNDDPFGSAAPGPVTSLAADGTDWLAVASAGSDPEPDGFPAGGGADLTAPEGDQLGVWTSGDGGSTWQRQDGNSAVWQNAAGVVLEAVGFAGSRVVVAGEMGGRLVVWTGASG